jgi:hypothetical protein
LLLMPIGSACCPRAATPSPEPTTPPVTTANPYGDVFEPTQAAAVAPLEENTALLEIGKRALEEGRFEDARDIFAALIEWHGETASLLDLHRRAEAMASADARWRVGVPECDDFLGDYARCIDESFPEEAREAARQALTQSVDAWREAAKGPARDSIAEACIMVRESMQQASEVFGCVW